MGIADVKFVAFVDDQGVELARKFWSWGDPDLQFEAQRSATIAAVHMFDQFGRFVMARAVTTNDRGWAAPFLAAGDTLRLSLKLELR